MILDLRVLGPVRLFVGGEPVLVGGPKPRALLAALAVNRRRAVASSTLADMIWNEEPPDAYAASLQVFVSNIRKALRNSGVDPAAVLCTESSGYRLEIADDACDLGRFDAARDAGNRAAGSGDHSSAAYLFGTALREWNGRALADLAGLGFADGFATAMEEERLQAVSARFDSEIACGRAAAVIGELVALTGEYPLREPLWGQLITALYLSERHADALEACRRVRTVLAEELGIDPGPALATLESRILRQEPLSTVEFKTAEQIAAAMTDTVTEVPRAVRGGQLRLPDGRMVLVAHNGFRIGRMTDNDLVLDDPKASRYHAQIKLGRAGLLVDDLDSANGVFVNEKQTDTALLADGDEIRIGTTVLTFRAAR